MKSLYFILLIFCMLSCSGTKKAITTTDNSSTVVKAKTPITDTVATRTNKVIKLTDSLYVPEDKTDLEINENPLVKEASTTVEQSNKPQAKGFNHGVFNSLLKKHVSEKGNVDYPGFKADYKKLKSYFSELNQNVPEDSWTKNETLAYWINAYNAFTIDLILKNYPLNSIKDIKDPWDQRLWKLGNKWYNLNEIEHEILRKMDEPRIHFAIVCASFSCPKLQNEAFVASQMEAQLTKATKEFLADSDRNSITSDSIEISKIFQWFAKDFKENGSLIDFLNTYTEVEISDNAKKRFKDYNWDLND